MMPKGIPNDSDNFVTGLPYTEYFQQNVNFEDVCIRAAILKQEVHTYAHIHNVEVWFDIYAMPLDYEEEKISYCLYSAIPNKNADAILDTFNTSKISNDVLKTCIRLHKANNLKEAIDELKSMGIQIAIDDFGTGYSSLSYLNRFPADLLKIDKSFIDAMNTSDSSRQYVAAIISMGHIMGFDVISEGVEEPEQLETLKEIGCDFVQGFIWGRPLPAEEVEKLVMSLSQRDQ